MSPRSRRPEQQRKYIHSYCQRSVDRRQLQILWRACIWSKHVNNHLSVSNPNRSTREQKWVFNITLLNDNNERLRFYYTVTEILGKVWVIILFSRPAYCPDMIASGFELFLLPSFKFNVRACCRKGDGIWVIFLFHFISILYKLGETTWKRRCYYLR